MCLTSLTDQRILARTRVVLEDYNMSCDDVSTCFNPFLLSGNIWYIMQGVKLVEAFQISHGQVKCSAQLPTTVGSTGKKATCHTWV